MVAGYTKVMQKSGLKFLFMADTHLGFDYPIRPRIEIRRRGQDFFDNFQRILDHAVSTRPDFVVHGGDVFFRSLIPPKIVDLAYEALFRFAQNGIPLFIVPGNHERSRLPNSLLMSAKNIHIFDRPRTYELQASGATIALSGFPCIRKDVNGRFAAVLTETGWEYTDADVKLLCMHQTVEGSRVSGYTFRAGRDVVSVSAIPGDFTAILSGHIHRKQILTAPNKAGPRPIIYPGSIERTSFAEKDEQKGFFEIGIALDDAGVWSVNNMEFVELPTRPMVDLEIDPDIGPQDLAACLHRKISALHKDSIVRLGSKGQLSESVRSMLTAPFLRSVLPPSMNYQLRASLYTAKQEEPVNGRK